MFKRSRFIVVFVLAVLTMFVIAACAGESENPFGTTTPVPAADAPAPDTSEPVASGPNIANGERKFANLGCSSCHSTGSNKIVGPGLAGIGARDAEYIRNAITDPGAEIVDGYTNIMPSTFANLKASDLDDLVGYLKTLN